jgi:hypothetical protein
MITATVFSGRDAVVIPQQSAEPIDSFDATDGRANIRSRLKDLVAQPLMGPLPVVVSGELAERVPQAILAEQDLVGTARGRPSPSRPSRRQTPLADSPSC